MLLPTTDFPSESGLPTSQVHGLSQGVQSIHNVLYTTLVVIRQQPRVFADQQLSCYVRGVASKTPKPKKFQSWTETRSFPDRVTWAREERGPTQKQLAVLVGCSQQNIGKAETQGAEGSSYTVQIAAELGVNALWLATGKGEPELNLKDVTSEAINFALAISHLPTEAKSPMVGQLLAEALPFIPASHPRYKIIEELYLHSMDSAVKKAAQKTDPSGKRPPPRPPETVMVAANDAPIPKKVAARRKQYRVSRRKK